MILIVEDQDVLLGYMARCAKVAEPSAQVHTATNAIDAIQIVREHSAELRLVLLDAHMPILDGRVAAVVIRQIAPNAWILPCTGDVGAFAMFTHVGCANALAKPLPPVDQMVAHIQSLLNGPLPEPLALNSNDPILAMAEVQSDRAIADYTQQPHVYRALLNSLNNERILLAFPKGLIDEVVRMLRSVSERLGGNRLIRNSIKALTEIE